jgi:lipopolysaccharide transport system ATP-binding protein
MAAITVNNVSKRFRIPHQKNKTIFQKAIGLISRNEEFEEFWAVKDVSFEVDKGETFGIIGRNGSGKSTLLKMLAKVLYPDSGIIATSGRVAPFLELGVGFQPELSASENIYVYSSILGMNRSEVDAVREQIFEFAGLKKFADMKLKNFSSGMYLRLAFSTAIHCKPDVILIDEVLSVGDVSFQKKCMEKIDEFQENGKTIVFVSHGLGQVEALCKRSLLLDGGKITALDTTRKVIKEYYRLMEESAELENINKPASDRKPPLITEEVDGTSCRITHSLAQPIPPGISTFLKFDTIVWDTDHMHDTIRSNTRITCKMPGTYVIYACVEFDVSSIGRRTTHFRVNGSEVIASQHTMAVSDLFGTTLNISCVQYLRAGDYVELAVVHSSYRELNINAKSQYSPIFGIALTGN